MTSQDVGYRSIWTYLHRTPHTLGYVDAGGVRTRYLEAGNPERPTVLLLHGTAGSLENFCANFEALAQDYHVLGIDLLGCGYTDKPIYDYMISDYAAHAMAFLDALKVDQATLIGVSLGSWIAARLALDYPSRVSAVIAMAPAGIIVDPEREARFAEDVRKRRGAAAADPSWETVTTAMSRLMLHQEDLIDDLVAVRLSIYQQDEMKQAMGNLLAFTQGGNALEEAEWQSIEQPFLVVASVDAPNMFLDNAYAIARLVRNSELVEMTGCDHWPQFEQPDQFHATTLDFLARNAATESFVSKK